ncbi:MAG TPA: V-type ATP synthase subunit E family protein [Bacillota bacterium]|nr:V-type ATP synthase subunit E family protein [Bacillota bacterium]
MSAETVIEKIREKAQSEADAIVAAAQDRSRAARDAQLSEACSKADRIIKGAEAQSELITNGSRRQSELDARIALLNTKRELLDTVVKRACELMGSLGYDEWAKLYTALVVDSKMSGQISVAASGKDAQLLADEAACEKKYGAKKTILEYWGSLVSEKSGKPTTFTLTDKEAPAGGMTLCSNEYDIDLSHITLCRQAFEQNEKAIAKSLIAE